MKKVFSLLLIFILVLLCSGCWNRTEVDKLAIVVGLGIDKLPGKSHFLLTAQIVNPSAFQEATGGGGGKKFVVKYAEGISLYDAIRNFAKDSPRRIFFSHNNVIVIGQNMARSGVQPILDFAERDPDFRRTTWMLVAPNTAKEILETKLELNELPAVGITDIINELSQTKATKMTQRKEFMRNLLSKSKSTFATKIELIDQYSNIEKKLNEDQGKDSEYNSPQTPQKDKKQLRITGIGLFQNDKLVGFMDIAEFRGLLWLTDKLKGGTVVFPCPDQEDKNIALEVNQTKLRLSPSFQENKLSMHAEIEEESTISEVGCETLKISDSETIKKLEELQNHDIEERVKQTVHRAQTLKSDILKFGDAFYRKDPKKWKSYEKDWNEHFAKVDFSAQVQSHIRHIGITSEPAK